MTKINEYYVRIAFLLYRNTPFSILQFYIVSTAYLPRITAYLLHICCISLDFTDLWFSAIHNIPAGSIEAITIPLTLKRQKSGIKLPNVILVHAYFGLNWNLMSDWHLLSNRQVSYSRHRDIGIHFRSR